MITIDYMIVSFESGKITNLNTIDNFGVSVPRCEARHEDVALLP